MNCVDMFSFAQEKEQATGSRIRWGMLLVIALSLCACESKEKKAGQVVAKVNGEEITILQVNDELERAGVTPEQQTAASKKLLESLIDRQLIYEEAVSNKLDRTPTEMQEIERAKMQIIAQKFLQNISSKIPKASKAEVEEYYLGNPEFFAQRREFFLKQLAIPDKDFDKDVMEFINSAKSLEEVAAWLDRRGVKYGRGQTTRSTADLPREAVTKLAGLPAGQLFLVDEGNNKILNLLVAARESPVSLTSAEAQIEQLLFNKKSQEAVEAEIAHMRSLAKIEYLQAAPDAVPVTVPEETAADQAKPN